MMIHLWCSMATPDPIRTLSKLLQLLPGVGPRQASRFAYSLFDTSTEEVTALARALSQLQREVVRCRECGRTMLLSKDNLCMACSGHVSQMLIVLEKDEDLEALDRSGNIHADMHLLDGLMALDASSIVRDRIKVLYDRVGARVEEGNVEVVLALPATAEGDATAQYIERVLEEFVENKKARITRLARGLSSGADLSYADADTLKAAFTNRK